MQVAPVIELCGVGKIYRAGSAEVVALADVSLDVLRGEIVAVTGPSGSGKTTLLNLIAGLDTPSWGTVTVFGEQVSGKSDRERTALRARLIGLVFQEPHLLPGLTALDNVIAARLPFESRRALEPRARALLETVGLSDRMGSPPARLSAGERQRVALARALLGSAPLLVADEPTGNLDADRTEEFSELLDRLRREQGVTVIVATHDPVVAAVADRAVRLSRGRLDGEDHLDRGVPPEVHALEAE